MSGASGSIGNVYGCTRFAYGVVRSLLLSIYFLIHFLLLERFSSFCVKPISFIHFVHVDRLSDQVCLFNKTEIYYGVKRELHRTSSAAVQSNRPVSSCADKVRTTLNSHRESEVALWRQLDTTDDINKVSTYTYQFAFWCNR